METGFVQAGPVRLQYFEHGSGPQTVLLVHGYRSSARIWRLVQEALDPAAYRSLAISNLGAGDSDRGVSPDAYTVESFSHDLEAAVRALDLRDCLLVGHSMGGATVTRFALDNPGLLRGLVLLNPAPLLGGGLRDGWEEQVRQAFAAGRQQEPGATAGGAEFQAALQADIARNPIERMLGGRRSMATLDLRRRLPELTLPVLVVGCDRDDTVGTHNIVTEYLNLRPESRSLHIFHGAGHSPNVECPRDLAAVLMRFAAVTATAPAAAPA